uniref:Uncharacterized protein n=1 Tax=Pseudomonas phage Arace01 TaxID=3138526 RepID=A0AAU6VZX4_9VIRU
MSNEVERVLYSTKDPLNILGDNTIPAMTTMLYKVCGNDSAKFDEAMRLVTLFVEQALNQGKDNV